MKMLIKCYNPKRVTNTDNLLILESKCDPTVVIDYNELDERGAIGTQVTQIDVQRVDGSISRFWVKVRATKRGRVECEVTCNDASKPQSRRKSIFGSWFKRETQVSS